MTNSRRKGKRTELELAALLKPFFPDVRRHLDQCRTSSGRDFEGTEPFCVQLKAGKAPSWKKALDEATRDADTTELPVGVTHEDRSGWCVHMALEDWLHMVRWGEP